MSIDELTQEVIGCEYRVHNELVPGFLEKVYENALRIELAEAGLRVNQQHAIPVLYHGRVVGDYFADLVVEAVSPSGERTVRVGLIGVARFNPIFKKEGPDGTFLEIIHPKEPILKALKSLSHLYLLYKIIHTFCFKFSMETESHPG